jgi:methionyl-tRNA formyltransferase
VQNKNYKKRIAVLGWGVLATEITKFLLTKKKDECEIVFYCPNDTNQARDQWQPSFRTFLQEKGFRILNSADINSDDSVDFVKSQKIDFLFSLQFNKILKKEILEIPEFGSINLHYSPLPKYRGVAAPTWALINGEKKFGVTLHYIDECVDTGDIIDQSIFNIGQVQSTRELYDLCVQKGVSLFKDNIDSIFELKNSKTPQDGSQALYYPRSAIDFRQNTIDWTKDSSSLNNWIKAFIFPPFQFPEFVLDGKEYEVVAVEPDFKKRKVSEKPGTLMSCQGKVFVFATGDSYIAVTVK